MDFTVELQPPMAFSLWWMAAVPVLLLLTAALLFFAWKKRNQKPEVAKEERTWELNPVTLAGIRVRYLEKLDQTENRLLDGSITVREAYREMSDIARGFASAGNWNKNFSSCHGSDWETFWLFCPRSKALFY